jgi:spermidine synthase
MKGGESRNPDRRDGADAAVRGVRRGVLLLAAFAAGFAITGIEIALGRLLAPHFGASLSVWACIIASVIAALAIGYPLGGVLADRRPEPLLPLAALLLGGVAGAGLGVAVPLWLSWSMAGIGLSGFAYWSRLSCVLLLFAVPCVLLASVPPAVLRLTLRDRTTTGRDAGLLYALGSAGSVLGVLLPALWWIPLLGVRSAFLLLGVMAALPVALGVMSGAVGGPPRLRAAGIAALLAVLLSPAAIHAPAASGEDGILYDADSGVQRIRVVSRDTPRYKRRWLQLNEGWTSHSMYVEPLLVTDDVWDWMALTALLPRPGDSQLDVLIIGLAGGSTANLMTRWLAPSLPNLSITGVELDPQVLEVAERYLGLDRSAIETVVGDGRMFLRGSTRRFELILLDAYHQPSIPAHMATLEFFEDVRKHLAPGGLAVLNVFAPARSSALLDGIATTWLSVFSTSQIFVGPAVNGFASHLLFGGPALPLDFFSTSLAQVPSVLRPAWQLLRRRTSRLELPTDAGAPWTDDRAPVEWLTDRSFRSLRPPNPSPREG